MPIRSSSRALPAGPRPLLSLPLQLLLGPHHEAVHDGVPGIRSRGWWRSKRVPCLEARGAAELDEVVGLERGREHLDAVHKDAIERALCVGLSYCGGRGESERDRGLDSICRCPNQLIHPQATSTCINTYQVLELDRPVPLDPQLRVLPRDGVLRPFALDQPHVRPLAPACRVRLGRSIGRSRGSLW